MPFRFRLQPILTLREQARDERRRELAQAYEAERILRERIGQMQAEIAATQERTRQSAGPGQVNVEDLVNSRRYELIVKSQAAAVETQLATVLEEIERRRQALQESDRDVKILEKLRERQSQQYAEVELRREAKSLDEAALRGYARSQEATP